MAHIGYHRYHIETNSLPDIVKCPNRFRVKVKKHRLILFLIEEILRHPTKKRVIFSRPCIYEVYGRPVGGLAPRQYLCVGCLRCTTEHPDWVQIYPNPKFKQMGDSYFSAEYVDGINYEARSGMIPVKGAGYRGKFGGVGWDSMWTDMSEIVRPTRDGIHGREFISTVVDIGAKPGFLTFDSHGLPSGEIPQVISIPLPILFDVPPVALKSRKLFTILAEAARRIETRVVLPVADIIKLGLEGSHLIPLVTREQLGMLQALPFEPGLVEMVGGDGVHYRQIKSWFPSSLVCFRLPFNSQTGEAILRHMESGVRVFHLGADYHGRGADGEFMLELTRQVHQTLVAAGCRDQVTLLASGGIVAAEHVPKAIICGLDAVVLDTALLVALQAQFTGDCIDPETSRFHLPNKLDVDWGVQRLENMLASWHDQMLEVMGAMGLREVRRLRGEVGRAMFQQELEKEAFQEISGYGKK